MMIGYISYLFLVEVMEVVDQVQGFQESQVFAYLDERDQYQLGDLFTRPS